MKLASIR